MPGGRPSGYNQEIAAKICERLATGKSLRTVCLDPDMPAMGTVFVWMGKHPEFKEQYAHAKEESADALAEEMFDISDDGSNDWMEAHKKNGEIDVVLDKEHVNRSRLRVDTRKWYLSKIKPKKYGERIEQHHTGEINKMSDQELEARLAALQDRKKSAD